MSLCIVYILVAVFDTLYKLILSRSQNFSSFVTGNVLYMIVLNREIHLVGVVVYGARKGVGILLWFCNILNIILNITIILNS